MRSLAFFMPLCLLVPLAACQQRAEDLDALQTKIIANFEAVTHLTPAQALALKPEDSLFLDIRESDEYAVSHLAGAVRVPPNSNAQTALSLIGDIQDKDIVVYCSVGWRSSQFAQRVQDTLLANGARSVSNLEAGIFGWHNETRPLIDATGKTDAVHPYDETWGRYVERREKARYSPNIIE